METTDALLNLYFYGSTRPETPDLQTEAVKLGVRKRLTLPDGAGPEIRAALDSRAEALATTLQDLRPMAMYASEEAFWQHFSRTVVSEATRLMASPTS